MKSWQTNATWLGKYRLMSEILYMYVLLCYTLLCLYDYVMSVFLKCHLIQRTIMLHWITLIFTSYIFSACPKKICVMDILLLFLLLLCFWSEYTKFVIEALELEDTIKNYERRETTGWFVLTSTFSHFSVSSSCSFDSEQIMPLVSKLCELIWFQ